MSRRLSRVKLITGGVTARHTQLPQHSTPCTHTQPRTHKPVYEKRIFTQLSTLDDLPALKFIPIRNFSERNL